MAFKSLVLDIDGVLIRDKLLLAHVKDNCVAYVRSKLPECKDPHNVNRILYLSYGHTARGLTNAFQVDTKDFNSKVYDKRLLDHLAEVIHGTDFQKEAQEVYDLQKKDWKITLFSNSPFEWAGAVAEAIGGEVSVRCPGADVNKSPLKPEASAFMHFPKHHTHLFVDDSLKNLGTTRWLANWHPVYFNEGQKEQHLWCPQIGSIWELCLYVNSVDQWMKDNHEAVSFPTR
jgi:FMN phosphatase YigB (HAD superfamily)